MRYLISPSYIATGIRESGTGLPKVRVLELGLKAWSRWISKTAASPGSLPPEVDIYHLPELDVHSVVYENLPIFSISHLFNNYIK